MKKLLFVLTLIFLTNNLYSQELTFHSARHTFATTVTLTNGVPIETGYYFIRR